MHPDRGEGYHLVMTEPSASAWTATAQAPSFPPLAGGRTADVVVVGAGIVGLTTALHLLDRGLRVVVLEARRIGSGTTGHTTGKVTSQHGLRYADLSSRLGEAGARRYAEANAAGVEQVADLVEEHGIDCDLTRAPAVVYTRQSYRQRRLAREVDAAQRAGLPAEMVDTTSLPFDITAGVRLPDQIHLHPVRYLAGLARAVIAKGGEIAEGSRVSRIDDRSGSVRAVTAGGSVQASWAVLATLLPIGVTGGLFARTTPAHSHGLAVRLRRPAPTEMTISADSPSRSTRPWDPGDPTTMIVVGHGHTTGSGDPAKARAELERWVDETFDLASVEHRWSAHDYVTADDVPFIGRAPMSSRTLVATGFAKWGLSAGTAAAAVLTDIVAGRENPWLPDVNPARIGGVRGVADTMVRNAQVGASFIGGRLRRADAPTCTHLRCPLTWNRADRTWDCYCHGSRFDEAGEVLTAPAVEPLSAPPTMP